MRTENVWYTLELKPGSIEKYESLDILLAEWKNCGNSGVPNVTEVREIKETKELYIEEQVVIDAARRVNEARDVECFQRYWDQWHVIGEDVEDEKKVFMDCLVSSGVFSSAIVRADSHSRLFGNSPKAREGLLSREGELERLGGVVFIELFPKFRDGEEVKDYGFEILDKGLSYVGKTLSECELYIVSTSGGRGYNVVRNLRKLFVDENCDLDGGRVLALSQKARSGFGFYELLYFAEVAVSCFNCYDASTEAALFMSSACEAVANAYGYLPGTARISNMQQLYTLSAG